MEIDYALLHRLHLKLRAQSDLNERIDKGPKRVKFAEIKQAQAQVVFDEAKEALTQGKMAAGRKQLQLNEREANVDDLKGKLNACKGNKEFKLLKDRIAADEQANSVQSDEILEQLERNDVLEAELISAKEKLDAAASETQKVSATMDAEMVKLKAELKVVEEEIAAAETKLPIDLKGEYVRGVAGKGDNALSETDKETCGNCNQHLTAQIKTQLAMQRVVICKACGSILYMTGVMSGS